MVFQKPAHSGAYGELCSASEHVSYFSTGDNPGSISADGRRRKNRGSSNDEHLTWDGLISEDLRASGPRLCTLPAEWRFITEDHPLYSRVTPDWDIAPKIFDICHRFNVLVEAVIFCTLQSVLQPESQPIFTAVIPAKKRDKNEDWVSLSREVLQFLHSEGIVGISVDIRDARAGEPDACFPIVESDAIFACWGKVLDSILDFCDTQDWSSVGCYRIGKDEKNWSQNPATVLVTVNKTASSRDWRPSREAIVAILDGFELPMVAVKIVGADIVCAASPTPPEFPNAEDLLESTVRVGKSVGRCQYEGESGTFGGWIELLDRETEQWRVFGLTCSHVALPDNVAGKVPKLYRDTNEGPRPQMDSPSQRDLDSRSCTLDKRSNDRTNNTEYIERQCKLETPGLSLTPLEQRYHDHDNAILSSIGQEKREIEAFKADHKHHLGSVVHASGTCRDVPSRTWADGSATSVDWALIDAPERCKTNMVTVNGPQIYWSYLPDSSLWGEEGSIPKLRQQQPLYKIGRETHGTEGLYSGIKHARIAHRIVNGQATRRITYEHTVTGGQVHPVSLAGDTGALVFTMDFRVVGMVVASMEKGPVTFITHGADLFADIQATTGAAMVRVRNDELPAS